MIRQFRNAVLAIGDFPEVVRRASDAAREDCMDSRSGSLCDAACRIDVRAGRCETAVTGPPAESVDAIGDHHDFPAVRISGPALHQVDHRKIRAPVGAAGSDGKPQGFRSLAVVGREVLRDLNRPIAHVPNSHRSGRRLCVYKRTQIVVLGTHTWVGSIVNQNEQIKSGPSSLRRLPTCYWQTVVALLDDYVFTTYFGHALVVTEHAQRNRHLHGRGCYSGLLLSLDGQHRQKRKGQKHRYFLNQILSHHILLFDFVSGNPPVVDRDCNRAANRKC